MFSWYKRLIEVVHCYDLRLCCGEDAGICGAVNDGYSLYIGRITDDRLIEQVAKLTAADTAERVYHYF